MPTGKAAKATSNGAAEKKDPVYTVAVIDSQERTLRVIDAHVEAKTQDKAMDAVDARADEWLERPSEHYQLVAWLANSTRSRKFKRRTMPVTESAPVEVTEDFFERPQAVPVAE